MRKLSNRDFPAKLLLFGEYSILFNSKAIVMPHRKFSGALFKSDTLTASQTGSHRELWWLYSHCLDEEVTELDLASMKKDLQQGMWFESTIPQGTGLGSSGAVVAAIFYQYVKANIFKEVFEYKNYQLAKKILAKMESYFHEKSSGVDPLASLLDATILIDDNSIKEIHLPNSYLGISVVDTKIKRQVKKVVSLFLEKCEHKDFLNKIKHDYLELTNQCVDSYIKNDILELKHSIKDLSSFQLNNLKEFIPDSMMSQWQRALSSDEDFFKLCGAGGGGHLIKLNCESI